MLIEINRYFLKKIFTLCFSLFLVATLTFFLMKMVPGDPFTDEQALPQDMHETLNRQYGFHLPWMTQYGNYMIHLFQGDLGFSLKYPGRSVSSIIAEGFTVSARLGLQAFLIALFIGILLGTLSVFPISRQQGGHWALILTTAGVAIPSFTLAALLQYLLAIQFPIFPLARWGNFAQTILPSIALASAPVAFITRLTRQGLLEVLQSDYIKLARSKGLPSAIWIWRHALPNALLPVLSYMGPLLANVLVGSFVIEKIFSIPGLGQWLIHSIGNRDYPLIMGLTLFYSTLLLTAVFLVDLLYGVLDPRIR